MAQNWELVPVADWGFFTLPRPMVIAGPCSAETEEQVMTTATGLAREGIHVFRAGIWKPRTHPGSFEGVGSEGLRWMKRVQKELGMKVGTEVASAKHVYECLKYGLDYLWIGARTTANPFLMQELADALQGTDIPILVKNPVNTDIDLWIGALERLYGAGIRKLGVIHRGFSSLEKTAYRNAPGWQMGLEGLMIESHCDPSCALSDAKQQLTPDALGRLLASLIIREKDSDSVDYRENIDQLRAQIDILDENLLFTLKSRMEISRKIGLFKKEHNIAILQTARWDELLGEMVSKGQGYGLTEGFVKDVFNAIHEASVQVQNEILSQD